jgi:alpha-L-arabinofuranosidase
MVALESRDGARAYAESPLAVTSNDWQRLDFTLTPAQTDKAGRFIATLRQPGSVVLGYALLQPGEWGRFKGLPVRKDVAEALIAEGVTVLRYGGSMVNHPQYRWKKMIGPRDRRPPYQGTWYPHSSNGWGILDFIDFCRAAGFLSIPAFNMGESPQDMADFIQYVNGPADSDWFDIHIGTEQPPQPGTLASERSFIEQLAKLSPRAKYKVVIFEFNAGNHALKRALANACAINQVERIGDKLPVACSANCLQPDGQNDNDWNQGLLFLNPWQVWLQPPGYVTRMVSQSYQPWLLPSEVHGAADQLSVNAKRSEDRKVLVLQVVNLGSQPTTAVLLLDGFSPSKPTAAVQQLAGSWDEVNTAQEPERIKPSFREWRHQCADGRARYTFPPHSFTIIRFE